MLESVLSEGARLRLFEESDAQPLYRLIDQNREYLARWLPWAAESTLESTIDFIRLTRRQLADNDGLQTAIVIDGQMAGAIGVHGISWSDESTSLGYWLAEEFQGRGVMTTAARAYTDHAFGGWRLNRVELRAAVNNTRSRMIAERLGFTREGVLREAEKVGERRHDLAVYSMLAADWRG